MKKIITILMLAAIMPAFTFAQGKPNDENEKIKFAKKLQDNTLPHVSPVICPGTLQQYGVQWHTSGSASYQLGYCKAGASTDQQYAHVLISPASGLSVKNITLNRNIKEYEEPLTSSWASIKIPNKKSIKLQVSATLVALDGNGNIIRTFQVDVPNEIEVITEDCCGGAVMNN